MHSGPSKPFREWVRTLWFDNCCERLDHKEQQIPLQEYFEKYKWWLRREYRYQHGSKTNRSI